MSLIAGLVVSVGKVALRSCCLSSWCIHSPNDWGTEASKPLALSLIDKPKSHHVRMSFLEPVTPYLLNATGLKGEAELVKWSAYLMILMGLSSFAGLAFVAAPYGKYFNTATAKFFGFMMPGKLAWVLQELPSFALPAWFWWRAATDASPRYDHLRAVSPNTVLLSLMLLHYLNRTFIFPLRLRGGKPTPFGIFLMAFVFCLWNG
jgi:hypothetical protein